MSDILKDATARPWLIGQYKKMLPKCGGDEIPVRGMALAQGQMAEANARLIVTAVNAYEPMLAALEAFIPLAGVTISNRNVPDDAPVPLDITMGQLRAAVSAIAKAKGEAS